MEKRKRMTVKDKLSILDLIEEFKTIDSTESWYTWVSKVNALKEDFASKVIEEIGNKKISTKRNKYSMK